MKKLLIMLSVMILQVFVCCTKEPVDSTIPEEPENPEEPEVPVDPEHGTIQFTLKGACELPDLPEGTIGVREQETIVENLTLFLFKDSLFIKSAALEKDQNGIYNIKEAAGKYSMFLIANAGHYIDKEIAKLKIGESTRDDLKDIRIKAAPNKNGAMVMLSDDVPFEIKAKKTEAIGKIEMKRNVIRIDILNGAKDVKIKSLKITNALTEASVTNPADAKPEELLFTDFLNDGVSHEKPEMKIGECYIFTSKAWEPEESTTLEMVYEQDGVEKNVTRVLTNNSVNHPDMIWGYMINVEKQLRVIEIKASMNKGYKPVFTAPSLVYRVGAGLGGAASNRPANNSIAAIKPLASEMSVDNAYFIFMKAEKLYSVQKGTKYSASGFHTDIFDKGIFDVMILANVSDALAEKLQALPKDTDKKGIASFVTEQAPDKQNEFLMVSKGLFQTLVVDLSWNYMQTVEMERLASRIDIINGVEGMTINKATFKNRAVKSTLAPAETDAQLLEERVYTGFEGVGHPISYSSYAAKIYSYQNISKTQAPVIVLNYTLNGQTFDKEISFDAMGGIKHNRLYSITLSGSEINVLIEQQSWSLGYTPTIGDIQKEKNEALAITRFSQTSVKKISGQNVEFCKGTGSVPMNHEDAPAFLKWKEGWNDGIYVDKDGNKFRVPNKEEMLLLFPDKARVLDFKGGIAQITFDEVLPDKIFGQYNGGAGKSTFMSKAQKKDIAPHVCYAKRFQGTEQYSAYRYEAVNIEGDGDQAYISIKVKALDKTDDPKLIYITDALAPDYWKKGVIEYRIPMYGCLTAGKKEPDLRGLATSIWYYDAECRLVLATFMNTGSVYMKSKPEDAAVLRMVKMN